jgi:hypothetical protein
MLYRNAATAYCFQQSALFSLLFIMYVLACRRIKRAFGSSDLWGRPLILSTFISELVAPCRSAEGSPLIYHIPVIREKQDFLSHMQ